MTPDQLQEHATDAVLFAIRHIGRHGGLREALTSSTKYPDPASQAEADMDVGMIAALIRTAKITVTWDDEPTPELPAWLIGAADQLVDDLGHPAPGSLTALVASAYRAGQMAAQSHGAKLTPALRGDGPCHDCGTTENICWFTESVFWNAVMGDDGGILCIPCFVVRADKAGYFPTGWRLLPDFHWETHAERDQRRATTTQPTGRV